MSSKKDIFGLKLAIEADKKLSHGAARLGLLVCSYIYNHPQHRFEPDEPFPLPWTLASHLCFGMSKREVYYCERELCQHGYFDYMGAKGCPAKSHFRLVLAKGRGAQPCTARGAQPCTARGASVTPASSAQKAPARGAQKSAPHTNTFPSEEIESPKEEIGSLRSAGTKGEKLAAAPKKKMSHAEMSKHWNDAKSKKGLA